MAEKKMTAPVLAHRDGRNKELTKKLTIIVPLLRAAVKTAALVGGVLALNALLGIWFALDEEVAT